MRSFPNHSLRGSAVLLALAAVAIATLLGLSLAASRDTNLATSGNLAKAAAARAAASGAVEIAIEMLNDPSTLEDSTGVLFESFQIGDTTVRATALDLATGLPAGADARAVEIAVEANCGGIAQTTRAVGRVTSPNIAHEADLDCSEFALLATETLSIEGDALVGIWKRSPLAVLAEPVSFGLASGTRTGLSIDSRASTHGCVMLLNGAFAGDDDDADDDLSEKVFLVPAEIQVLRAPLPPPHEIAGKSEREADDSDDVFQLEGILARDITLHGDARVPARSSIAMRGTQALDISGNLHVERGASVRVESPTTIIVRGNLVIDACAIEVFPGATLSMVVLGDTTVDASYLGGERSDAAEDRDASGGAAYDGGATRLSIFVCGDKRVAVSEGSVFKGELYAPEGRIEIESRSAVYGRILGAEIRLKAGAALFYDPTLDTARGWKNAESGIWTAGGTVQPALRQISTLDAESLATFAEASDVTPEFVPILTVGKENSHRRDRLRALAERARSLLAAQAQLRSNGVLRFYSLGFDTMQREND
jgi:hypothetical protein